MKSKFIMSESDLSILREALICIKSYAAYGKKYDCLHWIVSLCNDESFKSVSDRILNLYDLSFKELSESKLMELL